MLFLFFFLYPTIIEYVFFFFSSRRRHTRCSRDWSSDVCSSDLWNDGHRDRFYVRAGAGPARAGGPRRSEEHTSELQSRLHLVCRLLLEKKKKNRSSNFSCKKKNIKNS